MHNGKPVLNQCKAFLNMHTSHFKGKPFRGLMAVPNKKVLTLNTPKVSDSKRNPDGPALRLSADRWVLTVHTLKLQMIPSYSNALFMFLHLLHYHQVPLCVKVMKPNG